MRRLLISFLTLVFLVGVETLAENPAVADKVTFDQIWTETLTNPADTGFDNDVRAITVYNGDLIIGGYFNKADGFSSIKAKKCKVKIYNI